MDDGRRGQVLQRRWPCLLAIALGLLLTGCRTFPPPESVSSFSQQVQPDVVLAGVLNSEVIPSLARSDAVVIDLRGSTEGAALEGRSMAAAGITWINLPQDRGVPASDDVRLLGEILTVNRGRPIVLHCVTGNRAGKLWAIYRREQGVSAEDAIAGVAGVVTNPEIISAIRAYVPQLHEPLPQ